MIAHLKLRARARANLINIGCGMSVMRTPINWARVTTVVERSQLVAHGVDGFGEGAGAGGEADDFVGGEVVFVEFGFVLDVEGADAVVAGALDEVECVVGIAPPYHDEDVDLPEKAVEGGLAVARGLADGVHEADFGLGIHNANAGDDFECFGFDGGGLGDDAQFFVRPGAHLVGGFDNFEGVEVAGEAAGFDVIGFANDEEEVALALEIEGRGVGAVDEGAGGVEEVFSRGLEAGAFGVADAVGGDEDGLGAWNGGVAFGGGLETAVFEFLQDDGVVDELAADGDLGGVFDAAHECEGITDAEAHAHGVGEDYLHIAPTQRALYRKVK